MEERSGRLRAGATSAARGASAVTQRAGGELEAVGRLADAAAERLDAKELAASWTTFTQSVPQTPSPGESTTSATALDT
jgi:hypothetical protein